MVQNDVVYVRFHHCWADSSTCVYQNIFKLKSKIVGEILIIFDMKLILKLTI
jgi:hypothetical protein